MVLILNFARAIEPVAVRQRAIPFPFNDANAFVLATPSTGITG
jgi:hypothetical protein